LCGPIRAPKHLTVEARVRGLGSASQFDNGLPGDGVVVHEFRRRRGPPSGPCFGGADFGFAVPIDRTPGDYDFATCTPGGRTFPDQWYLGAKGVTAAPLAGATSSSYTTAPRTTTARYWVRVMNGYGITDSTSARATVAFSDNTLVAGVTPVRAIHLTELRARADALRSRFLLAPYAWYDPTISARITRIQWEHVRQLRIALRQAFEAAAVAEPVYTDPAFVAIVKAVHFEELRNAIHSLEER
jgi:hypothetical protein